MKAVVYHGKHNLSVDEVDRPRLVEPTDAIVKVTSTAICGSDLHLYDGYLVGMKRGDILGHEFMGEVLEIGEAVKHVSIGDRVVVPFVIACGQCFFCKRGLWAACDTSNTKPGRQLVESVYGQSPAGLFGYTHLFGGYPGGQAEYVRVPFANVGLFKVDDGLSDEQALFLSDILPTGYMAAENCAIQPDDTVAIWGAGPVGQLAAASARFLGARRVIMVDLIDSRLKLAVRHNQVETINFEEEDDVVQRLKDMTDGRGPDKCIDAVGMEAHSTGLSGMYDSAKQMVRLQTDKPTALRQVINACRKGGIISIPGVYAGFVDKFPLGSAFGKGLSLKMGQTHVHAYVGKLMNHIVKGRLDPSFIISHRLPLTEAPEAYKLFRDKQDDCLKVVLTP